MAAERVDLRTTAGEALRPQEIAARRNAFASAGFNEEWINNLSLQRPTLCSPQVLEDHLSDLTERGFSNPRKMVESLPTILNYTFENIDTKLQGLTERGFSNPRKMVESFPFIIGLAFENIDTKLQGLTERGFSNPHKMVESSPVILGLAFENIDTKLRFLGRVTRLYNTPYTAQELMENQNALFSSKIDKIMVLTRVLRDFAESSEEVSFSVINRTIFSNLEDVLVAINRLSKDQHSTLQTLLKQVKALKAEGMTKEEKREAIEQGLVINPKIKLRYLKGYPKR